MADTADSDRQSAWASHGMDLGTLNFQVIAVVRFPAFSAVEFSGLTSWYRKAGTAPAALSRLSPNLEKAPAGGGWEGVAEVEGGR